MKAHTGRFTRMVPLVLFAAAVLAGSARGERPDDRAGLHGVGGMSAISFQVVRPDDRSGLLGIGGIGGASVQTAIRPDDRAGRLGVGRLEPVAPGTPSRPDDRVGIHGPGMTSAGTGAVASTSGDPFEWGDAFVGAGATFGLLMLAGAFAFTHRSRGRVMTH